MTHPLRRNEAGRMLCGCSLVFLMLLPGLVGCSKNAASGETAAEPEAGKPPTICVASVETRRWPRTVQVQGSLIGDEQAVVGVRVAGLVDSVIVDVGSPVRQGDVLAKLDVREFQLQVEQAKAQLVQARASLGLKPDETAELLDRLKAPNAVQQQSLLKEARSNLARSLELRKTNVITAQELQVQQTAVEVAEARYASALNSVDQQIAALAVHRSQLALAEQHLADAVIRAPFDGLIARRHAASGVYLQVGDAVASLVRTNPLRFQVGVPEREAMRVRVGQPVRIEVEGEQSPREGQVSRISPLLDVASRSLLVEIDVANPDLSLRAGLFAEGHITVDPQAQTLAVPLEAINRFAGVEKVWLVDKDHCDPRTIKTGRRHKGWVEVLDGLSVGDQIAIDAASGKPGPVEVVLDDFSGSIQGNREQSETDTAE